MMMRRPKWKYLPGWSTGLPVRCAWLFLLLVSFLAIFGPWIANEKPYTCTLDGKKYYPLFSGISEATLSVNHPTHSPVRWNATTFESVWRTPVPYSYHTIDLQTGGLVSPFAKQAVTGQFRHWLGTDALGRDVLAGMIRGCRVSLLIGLGSMLLASLLGVPLGAASAYWGNKDWRMTRAQVVWVLFAGILIFMTWYLPVNVLTQCILSILVMTGLSIVLWRSAGKGSEKVPVPVDRIIMGGVSIIDGFPALFLILVLVAIIPVKGWVVVMLTIALLRWPAMARYMRAEVFKMREHNYIKAAQILNLSSFHILARHVIPYAFRPVMVSFIFGVSSAILAESSLSFLGIGLPAEEINWGRLLAQSRNYFDAWWLVVFPGSAIFLTLLSLYTIGNAWQRVVHNE